MTKAEFARRFGRRWIKYLAVLAGIPAAVAYLLAAIPGGQMLALIPGVYLSVPGRLLVGPPHFSAEFALPTTREGFIFTACFWIVFCGAVALAVSLFEHMRRRRAASHGKGEQA